MKRYLFDTNAISLWLDNKVPEKWIRPWKEIKMGNGNLILFEQLISETYYKNIPKYGKKKCKEKIMWLKNLPNKYLHTINNKDAFNAGDIKNEYKNKLSLVDCFLITIAKAKNAKIFTTDYSMRDIARKMKINVDYLPFKKS